MTIEKLKSGHYRITQMYKGKYYRKTLDYKPNKAEASIILCEMIENQKTFEESLYNALKKYVDVKKNVLSPSTIRDYSHRVEELNKHYDFMKMNISKIDDYSFQSFINDYASTHSPKTTKNIYALLKVAIKMFRKDFEAKITLPQKIISETYIPTDAEIKTIIECAKNTPYYIPLKILCYAGLRSSELYALTLQDIGDGEIKINKAKVRGENGFCIKTTKTTQSTRVVYVPKTLTDEIKSKGEIYNSYVGGLYKWLSKCQKENNITHFKVHALRHYFVSKMSTIFPEAYVIEQGGYSKNGNVMKSVYRHALKDQNYRDMQQALMSNLE